MENESIEKRIQETVSELLKKMGISGETEIKNTIHDGKENLLINIQTDEANFLIGQYGINLQSLQHIARVLARKKIDERVNFSLDVNFYRQEKNESIEKMARSMAEQALREKRAIVLRPMTAYERRIVHMELAKSPEIVTESIGEGDDRKVVIKPAHSI
jgi:spoIIIJ-associated protein